MGRLPGEAVDFAPAPAEQTVLRMVPENADSWEAGQTRGPGKGFWLGRIVLHKSGMWKYTSSLKALRDALTAINAGEIDTC